MINLTTIRHIPLLNYTISNALHNSSGKIIHTDNFLNKRVMRYIKANPLYEKN